MKAIRVGPKTDRPLDKQELSEYSRALGVSNDYMDPLETTSPRQQGEHMLSDLVALHDAISWAVNIQSDGQWFNHVPISKCCRVACTYFSQAKAPGFRSQLGFVVALTSREA